VTSGVVDERILHVTVDRVEKRNAFTPKISAELASALTRLDEDPELWVGVLSFAGPPSTGGLDLPRFFGPEAERPAADGPARVDPFGLGNSMYHLLRADEFGAAEAYRISLVQEVVEPGQPVERALALAREIAACAPLGVVGTIANARLALQRDETAALAAIGALSEAVRASADFQEGLASFVERRPARFSGR
jgi:enoyl-CoA hydratase/carnithine racemase